MKARASKLDPFAAEIEDWFLVGETLVQVRDKLAGRGLPVSLNRLSTFWQARCQTRSRDQLLDRVASGAALSRDLKKKFAQDAPPELATLIQLMQVLVMQLSVSGVADAKLLELAAALLRPVLEFEKLGQRKEELQFERAKWQDLAAEKMLSEALRQRALEIANSNLSNADKIAAMRAAAFAEVDTLQRSGQVKIPPA